MTEKEIIEEIELNGLSIKNRRDLSHIGKGIMKKHFRKVFERDFREKIASIDEQWGNQMANDFITAVELTLKMYEEEKMRYIQFVATKQ